MPSDNDKSTLAFNQAAQPTRAEPAAKTVPSMIEQERPTPRPRPPGIGQMVDEEQFHRRWQRGIQPAKMPDPFDAVDHHAQSTLKHNFNARSDEVSATEHHLAESEEQLALAIETYLNAYENAQTVPSHLKAQIERLHHCTLQAEQQVRTLQDTGKALTKPLTLGDTFEQAGRRAQQRQAGKERD